MPRRLRVALAAGFALAAVPALAAAPEPLNFAVEAETYTVPDGALTSVTLENGGLDVCLAEAAANDLSAFTARHIGETVSVAIGDTNVFYLEVTPYDGGCINWPLHPMVAKNYRRMLTGESEPE